MALSHDDSTRLQFLEANRHVYTCGLPVPASEFPTTHGRGKLFQLVEHWAFRDLRHEPT